MVSCFTTRDTLFIQSSIQWILVIQNVFRAVYNGFLLYTCDTLFIQSSIQCFSCFSIYHFTIPTVMDDCAHHILTSRELHPDETPNYWSMMTIFGNCAKKFIYVCQIGRSHSLIYEGNALVQKVFICN